MVLTGVSLPQLPVTVPAAPKPDAILKQPSLEERKKDASIGVQDVPFADIDPGVFNSELVKLKIYAKPDQKNLAQKPELGGGNIEEGTYAGTQAALTHAYSRIERSYESYFDVLQVEPTLPRYVDLSQKKQIYKYSAYPKNPDGTDAQYPPHLQSIPSADQVSELKIFNALGLVETGLMIKQIIPDNFAGKTARWLLSLKNGDISGAPDQGPKIEDYVEYNKKHRKSGTDIEQGANIGLLPDWFGDRRFAEQSFTGTNPTTIEKVSKDLLTEFIDTAKRDGWDYWAKTLPQIDPKSLFMQDTRYFRKAFGAKPDEELKHKEPASDDNWACSAVTLFQLHDDGKLHPIAIVCDYKVSMKNSVTIFNQRKSPADSSDKEKNDWAWRYAKTCAQVSDWIRHEVSVHLTRAHMIEESLIVATHRTIPMEHIVFKILQPHWYKTLSLNAAARSTLVPQVIKDLVGVNPDYLYRFVRYEFENFDYVKSYIPNDLSNRGFPNTAEGLADKKYKNYAYAKNMLSMWKAIRKYVMSMLLMYYDKNTADKMVKEDKYVQDWCKEVQTNGWIKTFPNIQTLDQLCDALTMSIHIAAPFHTAVNYLQNFYQAFVLSKPPALCDALPKSLAELKAYTEKSLVDALPIGRQREWLLAVQVPWLLSFKVPSDRSLVSFAQSQWRAQVGNSPEAQAVRNISEMFYLDLKKLDVEFLVTSKGMDEGSIPYMVMDPDNTAVSILI
ncbi:Manganese lipoxygenase [Fusarium keratoplasticum]|uniref:Manganese lipoxygenase n=1 Tax=Fusarium keratoplasticum TaxID=1328300 RepID=A0ACC0QEZ9_9HYPO|nr:Manganese lipoxygenase [Fusarium keratoplasticum]KAI8652571.1 Manganese lipoxygenase [Fusarium keratoplasticum]KAI8653296.1 Manganese lipoxygenase [Fusarium keratoplasticum]